MSRTSTDPDNNGSASPGAFQILAHVPLLSSLGAEALERLAQRSVSKSYPAGRVLFTTGEPCRGLFVVESGKVRIYRTNPAGREQVLHNEGPGKAVAELPLIDGGPYPASAVTAEESRLLFVPRAEFEALYRENPDVAAAIINELGKGSGSSFISQRHSRSATSRRGLRCFSPSRQRNTVQSPTKASSSS